MAAYLVERLDRTPASFDPSLGPRSELLVLDLRLLLHANSPSEHVARTE